MVCHEILHRIFTVPRGWIPMVLVISWLFPLSGQGLHVFSEISQHLLRRFAQNFGTDSTGGWHLLFWVKSHKLYLSHKQTLPSNSPPNRRHVKPTHCWKDGPSCERLVLLQLLILCTVSCLCVGLSSFVHECKRETRAVTQRLTRLFWSITHGFSILWFSIDELCIYSVHDNANISVK